MFEIFLIIAPVFIIIFFGYVASASKYLNSDISDSINALTIKFSIPVLLFRAMYNLDFSHAFNVKLLIGFYTGAVCSFIIANVLARTVWKRPPGEAVAVGFCAFFSNAVLLGLPIVERAYDAETLTLAYGIIAFHSPFVYAVGITSMEMARRDGKTMGETARKTLKSIFSNPLMIGIGLGVICNLAGVVLPEPLMVSVDMIASAALPIAVFGIGVALTRYKISSEISESLVISGITLFVYPVVVLFMTYYVFGLPKIYVQTAVTIASMPAGLNVYIFASMYNRAMSLSASVILISTIISVASITCWLTLLQHL